MKGLSQDFPRKREWTWEGKRTLLDIRAPIWHNKSNTAHPLPRSQSVLLLLLLQHPHHPHHLLLLLLLIIIAPKKPIKPMLTHPPLPQRQPFNAFLAGFSATVGQFVLTASLRMQTNLENKDEFKSVSQERYVKIKKLLFHPFPPFPQVVFFLFLA